MGEAVQRTHTVANRGQQVVLLTQDLGDACLEPVHRRVGEGDDQDFLVVFDAARRDQACGQVRQGERLATAGHGGDARLPVRVAFDNRGLFGTETGPVGAH